MVEDSVTWPYPTTYLITLNGRKYDKQIQLSLTYFQWWGHRIIIHVISEIWIWRDLITLVSRYRWTGYVNIFHIHGDELLCIVKAREGMSDTEDEHPLLCPQWPSILHWDWPSSACIDVRSAGTVDFSSFPATTQIKKTDGHRFN